MMRDAAGRVFAWAGAEDDAQRWSKIHVAWVVVSLHIAVRLTIMCWKGGDWARYLIPLVIASFVIGLFRPFLRSVAGVFSAVMVVLFVRAYPQVSNHYLVEILCVLTFAAVDLERDADRELCVRALCWLCALVLFLSGVQKVLYGCYFRGEFLAYMVAETSRFRDFFGPILPATDLAHLATLQSAVQEIAFDFDRAVGPLPGPYRVSSVWFVLASNAIWISEISVPILLLWKRTRRWGLVAGALLMLGIAVSSRELYFDTLFLNLLLLFARSDINRKLLPVSVAVYLYHLAGLLGIIDVTVW